MSITHRILRASAATAAAAAVAALAAASGASAQSITNTPKAFIDNFMVTQGPSTIPNNGDVNPYGVAFVPKGFAGGGSLQPGDVLAITARGFEGASVIGEKLIGMAKNKGAVAVVVDGMARDSVGIDSVGIPVFTRGITANSSHKDGPGTVGLPISLGGVSVSSGDLLVGDADGVVCVPSWQFDLLVARLSAIVTTEHAMFQQIMEGGAKPKKMAAVAMDAEIRYVD